MYNLGFPGLLKSWFDQIIRPHDILETTGEEETPCRGLLTAKRCILLTVRGSFAFTIGGMATNLNSSTPISK